MGTDSGLPEPEFQIGDTLQPKDERSEVPEFTFTLVKEAQVLWLDRAEKYVYYTEPGNGIGFYADELRRLESETVLN